MVYMIDCMVSDARSRRLPKKQALQKRDIDGSNRK